MVLSEWGSILQTNLKLSWRNLGRNPKRTALIGSGIAIAQIALMGITSFMNGFQALIFEKLTGPMLGHVQIHAPKYRDDSAIERTLSHASGLLQKVRQIPHVQQVSPRVYAPVLGTTQELGHVAMLAGLQINQELGPSGLLEGLDPTQIPGPQEALVGKDLAEEMGIHLGDSLALMGQAVDGSVASGLYRVKAFVQTPIDQLNRTGIIVDLRASQDFLAMDDQVHELAIHMDRAESIPQGLIALKSNPALTPYEILDWQALVPQLAVLLEMISGVNFIILILVFLTTISGIANTMLMATYERSHEFGMLLALGCRPQRLTQILLLESVILGLSGVAVGSLLGYALIWHGLHYGYDLSGGDGGHTVTSFTMEGMSLGLKIFPILETKDIVRSVIAVTVTSVLATLWPARRIGQLEPVEAMRS